MTRFTVVWAPSAMAELAELWMQAVDRREISAAANEIDEFLSTDAQNKGVDVGDNMQAVLVGPLRALSEVHIDDRLATVFMLQKAGPES